VPFYVRRETRIAETPPCYFFNFSIYSNYSYISHLTIKLKLKSMKAIIGVYESHDKAVEALQELQKAGYDSKQLSIVGKADLVNDHIHVKSHHTVERAEVGVGIAAGTVLGVLTGVGIFAIPGLGFFYGAGATVGAIAGIDFGLIAGGVTAAFTNMGIDEANAVKYEKHLNEGKFLVFAQGDEKQIKHAKEVLHTQGYSMELSTS
jgi:uncharacterized membrane protein